MPSPKAVAKMKVNLLIFIFVSHCQGLLVGGSGAFHADLLVRSEAIGVMAFSLLHGDLPFQAPRLAFHPAVGSWEDVPSNGMEADRVLEDDFPLKVHLQDLVCTLPSTIMAPDRGSLQEEIYVPGTLLRANRSHFDHNF